MAVETSASFGDLLRNATNLAGLQDVLDGTASTSFSAERLRRRLRRHLRRRAAPEHERHHAAARHRDRRLRHIAHRRRRQLHRRRQRLRGSRQVVKNTTDGTQCTIAAVTATTLTCPAARHRWRRRRRLRRRRRPGRPLLRQGRQRRGAASSPVGDLAVSGHGRADRQARLPRGQRAAATRPRTGRAQARRSTSRKADAHEAGHPARHQDARDFSVDTDGRRGETTRDAIGVADLLFHLDDATSMRSATCKASAGLGRLRRASTGNPRSPRAGWPSTGRRSSRRTAASRTSPRSTSTPTRTST